MLELPEIMRFVVVNDMDPVVVARLFATFVGAGLAVVFAYGVIYINPLGGVLWSGACLAAGALGGFVFGIPKTNPNAKSDTDSSESSQRVNTNLEEISDWVTKIIVGLGLANLTKIPGRMQLAAGYIAHTWKHESDRYAMGYALMLYFSVVGFIGGYLLTRIFLSPMLRAVDGGGQVNKVFGGGAPIAPVPPVPTAAAGPIGLPGSSTVTGSSTPSGPADAAAAVLEAYTMLENKSPAAALVSPIKQLETFKEQFPGFRMLFIILGRLYRWIGDLDKAIQVLTEFIQYKTNAGVGEDADAGAAYYNRGCYEALKAMIATEQQKQPLIKAALSDVSEAIKRSPATKGYATDDPDLASLKDQIQQMCLT